MVPDISLVNGIKAYSNTSSIVEKSSGIDNSDKAEGRKNPNLFEDIVSDSIDILEGAEKTTLESLSGGKDITDIVASIAEAEITLKTIMSARDKLVNAWQEVLRMPI